MNSFARTVLTSRTFRLCDRFSYKYLQSPLTSVCPVIQRRNYSDEKTEVRKLPQLMEFPPVVWPSFVKFIKNWMFANFIIRPYFESEFNLREFIEASKHAVEVCFAYNAYLQHLSKNFLHFIFTYSHYKVR